MKRIFYIILVLAVIASCDNGFEDMNVDPTRPSQVSASSKLTAVQLFTSGDRYENWRANLIYSSTMMQHFASLAGYWTGDKYTRNAGYASSLMERYYGDALKNLINLQEQLDAEESPDEMKGIARIMRVFIFSRLTDMYGDLPYFEAGKAVSENILKPVYDEQSVIYPDMLNELQEAVGQLGTGTSEFGDADIMFQGDQEKWQRFGNSLMLRLALRLIKVDPAGAQQWASAAISGGVMQSNDDIAYIEHTLGPEGINRNGNGQVFTVDNNMIMSETFINALQGDPRISVLAQRRSDGSTNPADLRGLPNGLDSDTLEGATGETTTDAFADPNRDIITGEDAPMFFQTYAEVEFMLAEANVRWGLAGDAETHYNNGVRAAMEMLAIYGDAAIIDSGDIDDYLTANPYDAVNAIEQIATQYWIATFLNEYEAFSNWRRTGFPALVPVDYPGNVTNGTIPRRLTYSEGEKVNNTENYNAAVSRQGPDEFTTRVWWDVE
ncbi:SusD/RagB family nutrient-binding outer membrane lipoprotein [Flagellimonas nanhaiensis]|uniref:SusD/RagB family nutrient-binding outer membrane lipoprotein n=1 Tax=Flagellimonas nanhaiensis TaxID=2292706 RepID=A0A371JSS5_9FLAO|nr:SusD/RagB family nutrient-binding outer membrane lipoprotein [Allomuricauda nanhaiensis]RDY60862.1 SusD/RagB family nutrient-binding outer membrane lipoprotein [Allomuricauda nanhaiensis]